jgi:tetratricopeptide (TPR) repeat protein
MADNPRIEELRRRVQMDPASIAFAALAEEHRRAGEFDDAIAVCEAGLQRHPAYLSARVTLGRSLVELGRFDEARHQLQLVLRAAPENLAAIRALAEIHDRGGDDSDAQFAASQEPLPAAVARLPDGPIPFSRPAVTAPAPVEPARVPPLSVPAAAAASPPPSMTPSRPEPPAVPARVPHPDEAALPALEEFLAAIQRARATGQ